MIKTILRRLGAFRKQEIIEFQSALENIFEERILMLGDTALAEFLGSISSSAVLLLKDDSGTFLPRASFGFRPEHIKEIRLGRDSALVSYFGRNNQEEIRRSQIKAGVDNESILRELDALNARVCFPIRAYGELFGFLALGGDRFAERRIARHEFKISLPIITLGLFLANLKLRSSRDKLIWGSQEAKEITEKLTERYKDDPDFHIFCQKICKYREEFFANEEENKNWQSLEFEKRLIQVAMNFFDSLREGKSKEEAIADLVRQSGTKFDPVCVEATLEMYRKGII